jgi:hypothetical protein
MSSPGKLNMAAKAKDGEVNFDCSLLGQLLNNLRSAISIRPVIQLTVEFTELVSKRHYGVHALVYVPL